MSRVVRSLGPLETLRQRDFRYLLLTTGLERLGFRIREMAQAWLVLQLTDSRLWVGLVNGLPVLPVLALSLWGGVLADRGDRRRLLIRTRFVLAGLAFILAFLVSSGAVQLWHILALAIAAALFNSFGITATQTLIYDIVGRARLMSANILFGATYNLVTFAGPSVGGIMMGVLGLDVVFYCIAAVYVVGIGMLLLIPPRPQSMARDGSSISRDLLEGLSYMRRTPEVLWLGVPGTLPGLRRGILPLDPGLCSRRPSCG